MSNISRAVIDALWPKGSVWSPNLGGSLDDLLDGIAEYFDKILLSIREIKDFRNPETTTILDDLEYDLGYIKRLDLSDQARRELLSTFEKIVSDGTGTNLEAVLNGAGFDVQVHENDPAADPSLFITPDKLLVGTIAYTERNKWLAVAGRMVAGNQDAVAGRYDITTQTPVLPIIPPAGDALPPFTVVGYNGNWLMYSEALNMPAWVNNGIPSGSTTPPPGSVEAILWKTLSDANLIFRQEVTLTAGEIYRLKTRLLHTYSGTSDIAIQIYKIGTGIQIANNQTTLISTDISNQIASIGDVSYGQIGPVWKEIDTVSIAAHESGQYMVQITKTLGTQGIYYSGMSLTQGEQEIPYQYTEALDGSFTNIRVNRAELAFDSAYDAYFIGSENNYLGTGISGPDYTRVVGDATVEGFVPQDVVLSGPVVINPSWYKIFYVGGDAQRDSFGAITAIETVDIDANQRATFEFLIHLLKPLHSWAGLVVNYI